jgi:hypothetical protein
VANAFATPDARAGINNLLGTTSLTPSQGLALNQFAKADVAALPAIF